MGKLLAGEAQRPGGDVRLVLTLREVEVFYLELRWPGTNKQADAPTLEASGSGSFDRADPYGDPATQHGFGFRTRTEAT